jgi:hypothetical protein
MASEILSVPTSDPSELLRRRDGIYATDLLVAAVGWLDFFGRLAGDPLRLSEICRGFGLEERPADVMLTLFRSMGLVEREGDLFRISALARDFLTSETRFGLGPYFATMRERAGCREILGVLQTGRPISWGSKRGGDEWAVAIKDSGVARSFTSAMDGRGAYLAPALASKLDLRGRRSLLDIAGGSAVYACSIAASCEGLKATVLERPPVEEIAREFIERRGMADTVSAAAGDMFVRIPPGYDVHLFSNVLHDWGEERVRALLRSSFEALPGGGMVAIHDAHVDEEKAGPLPVAEYSVLVMCSTEGKCYSLGEMRAMLKEAGFVDVRSDPTAAWRTVITATRPA